MLDLFEHATYEHVSKPWGQEWIITAGDLIFKVIGVDEGMKTSLQHHEQKDEVIFVLEDEYTSPSDGFIAYGSGVTKPGEHVRIRPNTIHRTFGSVLLFEVSTNHPDDVVRHADDYGREGQ
jgi:mannose-6-phosphate isomerase-like protein (cupin superfamily)